MNRLAGGMLLLILGMLIGWARAQETPPPAPPEGPEAQLKARVESFWTAKKERAGRRVHHAHPGQPGEDDHGGLHPPQQHAHHRLLRRQDPDRLWHLFGKHDEGNLEYYMSTIGGVIFIMLVAFIVQWGLVPLMAKWGRGAQPTLGFNFASELNLNYVVMGIVAGIVVVNLLRVPAWAENGVRLSRLGLKTGVVLLGVLYSFQELAQLGKLSVALIGVFVLGSVALVLWWGRRRSLPNSMTGVLSAGVGVCGVSAAVAAAPVVQAKWLEIAYTIGTILLFGVVCMFALHCATCRRPARSAP